MLLYQKHDKIQSQHLKGISMNLKSYQALIEQTDASLSIYANTASFLYQELPTINWAGFYFLKDNTLHLGPFMGKPACTIININNGVCGKCVRDQQTIVVKNVHEFDGHIACDSASNSEIVLPLFLDHHLIGVLDIDSFEFDRFSTHDKETLEELVSILMSEIKKATISITL